MRYQYYPGCSLEGTAREYDVSTRAVLKKLGTELVEIDGWSCCGASAAEPLSLLLSHSLAARNIALAETDGEKSDILTPCSACYLNLKRVEEKAKAEPGFSREVNLVLKEMDLEIKGGIHVRHLLDIFVNDIDPGTVANLVKKPMDGFVIAPYYGCQCLRPYTVFDDPETPKSMNPFIEATGASVHEWNMGGRCCGASHMNTKPDVGIELVAAILDAARGADAILTVCPMCQMNLEAFQSRASTLKGRDLTISILYLPQFLGLAFGLDESDTGIASNLAVLGEFKEYLTKTA